MKKVAMIALLAVSIGAFAGTLGVPWFIEGATQSAYVTITNTTAVDMLCAITYYNADGVNRTPTPNSFSIPAFSALGFRPTITDGGNEGPGSDVPNKLMETGLDPGTTGYSRPGPALITFVGAPGQLAGRVLQITPTGPSAYLLP